MVVFVGLVLLDEIIIDFLSQKKCMSDVFDQLDG